MFTVLFHSTSNKYSSPDGITMIPSFSRQSFLQLFVFFKSHRLGLCCSIHNLCLKVYMGRKSKEIIQEKRENCGKSVEVIYIGLVLEKMCTTQKIINSSCTSADSFLLI